jgi:hypothetical protein
MTDTDVTLLHTNYNNMDRVNSHVMILTSPRAYDGATMLQAYGPLHSTVSKDFVPSQMSEQRKSSIAVLALKTLVKS